MNSLSHDPAKKVVLFHRDFQRFTGGHLKVWNYFNHVLASPAFEPRIAFTPESIWNATNPWNDSRQFVGDWDSAAADVLFLAGTDWRTVPDAERTKPSKPIINLIQHQRHADPQSELRGYLKHRATRICVSEDVAATIREIGEVNGPVLVIPNGVDLSSIRKAPAIAERNSVMRTESSGDEIDILICGLKAPELARELSDSLADTNANVHTITDWMPRPEYLQKLSDARITIFLPRPVEGFYLPALEGMACGTVVVCPDCYGNRDFCIDGANCLRPQHNGKSILAATRIALAQSDEDRTRMLERAKATVDEHSLASEREKFLRILTQIEL